MVLLANDGTMLSLTVVDDGTGLPDGFALDTATGLGLSIVRTLVTTELGGTIDLRAATAADFEAAGLQSSGPGRGTVVALKIPVAAEP